MKTIAIFSGYALPHLGGIERYVANLSNQLKKMNYKVIVISSNYNNFKTIEEVDGILNLRVPIYKLFSSRYPIIKHHNLEYKKVINELNKYKIDRIIVNTRFHLTSLMGAKYGKKRKIPVYLIEHGSNHLSINNKFLDFFGAIYEHILTKKVEKYVDKNYGVSLDACKWQEHFNIISDGVWYNSINRFDSNVKIKKSDKIVKILFAGRILKQKGVEDLIIAFNNALNKNKKIELIIAGDGDYLNILKEKYKDKKIKFLGKVNFDELVKLYAEANIFVHPSHYPEGLPTCILEAGLMECTIITTPNGGTKYFINSKNGIIVESQEELNEALEKCVNDLDYCKSLGKQMRKTVINDFSWDKTTKKILKDMEL